MFNRPSPTRAVLERIRAVRPRRLAVIADGPRPERSRDAALVAETRSLVEAAIDWPCEFTQDYADTNLGCGPRIAGGLTNAFERLDRAIVLEDDTVPSESFFSFCELMLDRYASDPGVVHVSGTNAAVGVGALPAADAYRRNRVPDIWGWATWAEAWRGYDFGIEEWGSIRETDWLATVIQPLEERTMFTEVFDAQWRLGGNRSAWDWSWVYRCLRTGDAITPMRNLVTNVGFGSEATNTPDANNRLANLPRAEVDLGKLDDPEPDPSGQLDRALLAHRFWGDETRRRRTLAGRLSPRRIAKNARRIARQCGRLVGGIGAGERA